MTIEIEILTSAEKFSALRTPWNAMVREDSQELLGLDGTSTFEWFETIINVFPEASQPKVIVAKENGQILGILPILEIPRRFGGTELLAPTELYGGRNGPILLNPNQSVLIEIYKALDLASPNWTTYRHTLVMKSPIVEITENACWSLSYPFFFEPPVESLFFPITPSEEAYWSAMGKDLKQRIRRNEKLLAQQNVKVSLYGKGDNAEKLFEDVLTVERQSWKHEAGTAITNHPRQANFYRDFFPRGLQNGILNAIVLRLDNEPIAYTFGLFHQNVFCSLKTSFASAQKKSSPSHVAHHLLIQHLREKNLRLFDFMGVIDPHKLRWSNQFRTYERRTLTIHNNNLHGKLAWWLRKLKLLIRNNRSVPTSLADHAE